MSEFPNNRNATMSSEHLVSLTSLLPSTRYILAYALPLLCLSAVLTFAGAFLTLDRTRSFKPHYDTIPGGFDVRKKNKKFHWILEGGLGGLATGYAFGVHFSTFLALLIPNISSSPSLGPKSFVPVWLLSTAITTFLAGRWKYAALVFVGVTGGSTIALSLSVVTHPSLLTRVVLTSILLPLLTLFALLPISSIQHRVVRLSASATGAFGLVLSIALLSRIDSWANVWERFWVKDGANWGGTKERGLSAAWCLFWALGIGCDWMLKRRFGENPDEKWDHYLANYAANLPNASDRAGTFQPLSYSLWNRFFRRRKPSEHLLSDDTIFPHDSDLKSRSPQSTASPSGKVYSAMGHSSPSQSQSQPFNLHKGPGFLRKGKLSSEDRLQEKTGRRKERIKFGDSYSDASSDSDSDGKDLRRSPLMASDNVKPWLKGKRSISSNLTGSVTLNSGEESGSAGKRGVKYTGGGTAPQYSDYEEDVTAHVGRIKRRVSRDQPGWSPDFIKRRTSQNAVALSNSSSQQTAVPPAPGAVPIPATPSLIKAIDRVALAQQEAFASGQRPDLPSSKRNDGGVKEEMPPDGERKEQEKPKGTRWDDFWRDVRSKAGQH